MQTKPSEGDIPARLARVGLALPDLLLPSPEVDLSRWAVNACDQHVHDRSYWDRVRDRIGGRPSALSLILPEADLRGNGPLDRIRAIHRSMEEHIDTGILRPVGRGCVVVDRTTSCGTHRKGLLLCFDLEAWHRPRCRRFALRPTERVVVDRLPARLSIRRNAALELPHALVLADDHRHFLSDFLRAPGGHELYRTRLAEDAGMASGTFLGAPGDLERVVSCLEGLVEGMDPSAPAWFVGDGNHSLESARMHWDGLRTGLPEPERRIHPARLFLAELIPLQSPGLELLPVHRLLHGIREDSLKQAFEATGLAAENCDFRDLRKGLQDAVGPWVAGWTRRDGAVGLVPNGTGPDRIDLVVEAVLQRLQAENPRAKTDYLHGWGEDPGGDSSDVTIRLPTPTARSLAEAFRSEVVFAPKSFSLGTPADKRHYLEARRLRLSSLETRRHSRGQDP